MYSALVEALQKAGVEVILAEITDERNTPDAIFPNNWLSIHDGTACKYPMKVPNRRDEVRQYMVDMLKEKKLVKDEYDMTAYVAEGKFFEGTGALVLDRANRIAYCNLSQRANAQLAVQWANRFGYKLVLFEGLYPPFQRTKSSFLSHQPPLHFLHWCSVYKGCERE